MEYELVISKPVQKQIDKLPPNIQIRVDAKVQSLKFVPRPDGVVKMKGCENEYRIRVSDYRVRYRLDDERYIVRILYCGHRRDIYKDNS